MDELELRFKETLTGFKAYQVRIQASASNITDSPLCWLRLLLAIGSRPELLLILDPCFSIIANELTV